jgi:hypothetical protein
LIIKRGAEKGSIRREGLRHVGPEKRGHCGKLAKIKGFMTYSLAGLKKSR